MDEQSDLQRLQAENERLRKELARIQNGIRLSSTMLSERVNTIGMPTVGPTVGYTTGTIMGLDELIIQVAADGTIGYLNAPMAKLLGVPSRQKVLGDTLEKWDNGSMGNGTLSSVIQAALSSHETLVVERMLPDLDVSLLPHPKTKRPASAPILRFVATSIKGRVELIIQDVTRLRWLENTFARYVPNEVIEQMITRTEEDFMKMERREISVLFVDIRGFTSMTQTLSPSDLQQVVNAFLSSMVKCIQKHEGTVDKFVGDEVMGLFGAPVACDDHALRALLSGLEMQKVHTLMMKEWQEQSRPSPGIGVGIATGPAIIGNIGTPSRMDYTALGHTVNLAARLCSKAEAGQTLTVKETFHSVSNALKNTQSASIPSMRFSPKGRYSFKNIDEQVEVLSVTER